MERLINLDFNSKNPTIMHLDLNSCFASVEQQANPLLRDKPMAVAAYDSPGGCIIASSVEAKRLGIKVGMRVKDGRSIYPELIIKSPDPGKYRSVHLKLKNLLDSYTDKIAPKSIDEFVLDFDGSPAFTRASIKFLALEIKQRIKNEVGDWLRVSVGIGPNRFLAKTGAGLHKPDGLDVINKDNFQNIYQNLRLGDLCGIKLNNIWRLNRMGIFSVTDFYRAKAETLKAAFGSVVGYYWYLRLRGYEADAVEFGRRSYGNSYALPRSMSKPEELAPILQKLVYKTGMRMRKAGWKSRGVGVGIVFKDWDWWHKGHLLAEPVFDSGDIYKAALKILIQMPLGKPVHTLSESCFDLVRADFLQTTFLDNLVKKEALIRSVDEVNQRWGNFVLEPARMMGTEGLVPDRIAFGGVKELEELVMN